MSDIEMRLKDLPKEIILTLTLVILFIVLIPLFQELGADYLVLEILIFGIPSVLVISVILITFLKQLEKWVM